PAVTPSPVVIRIRAQKIFTSRFEEKLSRPISRTVKINSPPVSLRLVMSVHLPKSPTFCAGADSNRFGKIGTRRFLGDDRFAQWRERRGAWRANNRRTGRALSTPPAIHFDLAQRCRAVPA